MAEIRQGDSVSGRPYTNDKNDNFTLLPREYWISPDALVILLNALDNPQYAQVSLLSGAVVMAYRYGVIDYSYNMNYRTWTLQAFNTLFDRTDRVHVYAQLDKDGKDALIIYSYDKLELQGIATDNTGQQKNVFNVYLGTISAAVDDQGADIPRTWEYPLVTGNLRTDLGINQGQTLWVDNFEIRTDDFGVEYLFAKKPLATIGGLVQYATPDIVVPSLFEGIPFDNKTIWLNPDTKVVEVIGGGGTGDLNLEKMWAALAGNTSEQINISHLTSALNGYATQEWVKNQNYVTAEGLAKDFVTIATEQEITGLKHFTAGLSVGTGKHKLYEKDGVVYFDGDFVVTGGITQYGMGDRKPSTIMDGVVVDGTTISKDGGVLKVIGGGASFDLAAMWSALAGNTNEQISINHLTTALAGYATTTALNNLSTEVSKKWTQDDAKIKNWDTAFGWGNHAEAGYAHLDGEETFTGLKHFTKNLTVGAGKKSIYEKDGVVYIDADVAVTGGLTQYALGNTPVSTIMDGVVVDGTTIKKENGKLVAVGGSGSFDPAQMWQLLKANTAEQINLSHLTTALQGYATQSWANSNFPTKTGNGASGTWGIDISGVANYASRLNPAYGVIGSLDTLGDNTICTWNSSTVSKPSPYGTIFQFSNVKNPKPGTSEHWINQIAYGTNERMYVRQRINNGSWTPWRTLAYISDTIPQAENSNKLQNLTWSDFFSRRYYYLDYGAQSTSNFYPIFFFPNDIELDCEIHSDNVSSADAYNQNRIHFQLTAQGWSDTGVSFRILSRNNYSDSEITIGAIGYGTKDGGIAIWVRGGKRYRLYCNKTPNMKTSDFAYGSNGEKYTVGTNLDGGTNSSVNIIWKNDSNRNNGLVATVDGNVYSATKLQNTKTIWGQSFNGEQNVSGDLRNVGVIYGNSGVVIRDSAGNWIMGKSTSGNNEVTLGSNAINQPVGMRNSLGSVWISSDGNVGVGTTTPAYKLDVAGDIQANGWVRTKGSKGWYAQDWGGGWYMQDSNWIRAFNDKSVYTNGAMQAGKLITTSSGIDIIFGNNTEFIRVGWEIAKSDFVRFRVPGNNNQSKYFEMQAIGTFYVEGNILASGGITQYSDSRAKTIIEQISLSIKDIAQSPAIRFKWNGWKHQDDGKTHIGGIAQYVQRILPEAIYDTDGALTMDYAITGYIFAVNTAKHLLSYETKTDKEIKQLKKRVKYLEKQLKKLGYEETDTLAN